MVRSIINKNLYFLCTAKLPPSVSALFWRKQKQKQKKPQKTAEQVIKRWVPAPSHCPLSLLQTRHSQSSPAPCIAVVWMTRQVYRKAVGWKIHLWLVSIRHCIWLHMSTYNCVTLSTFNLLHPNSYTCWYFHIYFPHSKCYPAIISCSTSITFNKTYPPNVRFLCWLYSHKFLYAGS